MSVVPQSEKVRANASPPEFFESVEREVRDEWETLKARPTLAGPWRQMFLQLQQSTRHVLSELLQNADDTGATKASARIEDGSFIFEHNGADFDRDNFISLCQFACSNKRKMHTIGFRGIGFKSTFSVGDPVYLTTPTLSVYFERDRFTYPVWNHDPPKTNLTQIRVPIQDASREAELRRNFDEWANSPVSLLFFHHVSAIDLNGLSISKRELSNGPIENSFWFELAGNAVHKVLLVRSRTEAFPAEAIDEIRQEREVSDYSLPPCHVELVLGLPSDQRIYSVLPTDVRLQLPFSCNAPFVQDPARTGIKSPSRSTTNRWLLSRVGDLAAESMQKWLSNRSLKQSAAADAYRILPHPKPGTTSDFGCSKLVSDRFAAFCQNTAVCLTTDGRVVANGSCCVPPRELYQVWSTKQIADFLGWKTADVLAAEVSDAARGVLALWGWIDPTKMSAVLDRLQGNPRPPRPSSWEKLAKLWHLVEKELATDYDGHVRRNCAIIPVDGCDHLLPTDQVLRLPTDRALKQSDDLAFLTQEVALLDPEWVEYLAPFQEKDAKPSAVGKATLALLEVTEFDRPDSWHTLVSQASRLILKKDRATVENLVRLAKIHAHLDCRADDLQYVSRKPYRIAPSQVLNSESGYLETILPESWVQERLLHESYEDPHPSCDQVRWARWLSSANSAILMFPSLVDIRCSATRSECDVTLDRRGMAKWSTTAPRKYANEYAVIEIEDFDFDDVLVTHWQSLAKADHAFWAKFLKHLLVQWSPHWNSKCKAKFSQKLTKYSTQEVASDIPAQWIHRLHATKCLPDTAGVFREPSELLLRNAETEVYSGVESFVALELDTDQKRSLLVALGVRTRLTSPDTLLKRLRMLATASSPHIGEVSKYYGKLDSLLSRSSGSDRDDIIDAFISEPLILTSESKWTRIGNVFRKNSDDELPGITVIYPAVADLRIWSEIGVEERPTEDLMVAWVANLPIDTVFDPENRKRLKTYLKRFAKRIWNECGKWISIDDRWQPLNEFRYSVGYRQKSTVDHLFPKFKAQTADLSMLSDADSDLGQTTLQDLFSAITPSVDGVPIDLTQGEIKPWMLAFGQSMLRFTSDDPEQEARIREAAERLSRTVWLHVSNLRSTPYIDGLPAGEARTSDCAWERFALLVRDESFAKYSESVIRQLAKPFGNNLVADAIRSCIDRDRKVVEEYLSEKFSLAEVRPSEVRREKRASPEDSELRATSPDQIREVPDGEDVEDNGSDTSPLTIIETSHAGQTRNTVTPVDGSMQSAPTKLPSETGNHHSYVGSRGEDFPRVRGPDRETRNASAMKQSGGPTLMTEFAKNHKFKWSDADKCYTRNDGCQIVPAQGPFHWAWMDHRGEMKWRLWVAEQSLQTGVEMNTEVWVMLKQRPVISGLILRENRMPKFVGGSDLLRMTENNTVGLFPATYRLKQKAQ
jgi:hypothetical protein